MGNSLAVIFSLRHLSGLEDYVSNPWVSIANNFFLVNVGESIGHRVRED